MSWILLSEHDKLPYKLPYYSCFFLILLIQAPPSSFVPPRYPIFSFSYSVEAKELRKNRIVEYLAGVTDILWGRVKCYSMDLTKDFKGLSFFDSYGERFFWL